MTLVPSSAVGAQSQLGQLQVTQSQLPQWQVTHSQQVGCAAAEQDAGAWVQVAREVIWRLQKGW